MKNKIILIITFLLLSIWPAKYFLQRGAQNAISEIVYVPLPPIDIPKINDNRPNYTVEMSIDGNISWSKHPYTETIHIITNENNQLIGVKFIDITDNEDERNLISKEK